jgi:hypothetical protein
LGLAGPHTQILHPLWHIRLQQPFQIPWHGCGPKECLLAQGDNTLAIGWLYKSGRIAKDSIYYEALQIAARKLAKIIIDSNHGLASQHILGELNTVADWLSYVGGARGGKHPLTPNDPSDQELTRRFHLFLPTQIPQNFAILPLPNDVLSWLT